jgi:excisionase family DNA binding protein
VKAHDASTDAAMPTWLTTAQVGRMLQVDSDTVGKWVNTGRLPALKVGAVIRISASDLDEFIKANTGSQRKRARLYT